MDPSRHLIEGSISRSLRQFCLPILYTYLVQCLTLSVNSAWVGRGLGEAALTATSNANTIVLVLLGAMAGIGTMASALIGQAVGRRDRVLAMRVLGTSTILSGGLSLGIAALAVLFSGPILLAMKTPPESIEQSLAYLRVLLLALPITYFYVLAMALLRASGDSRTPFRFGLLTVALDLALNPALIFGFGPIPRLGVAGSALATVSAQSISLLALLYWLTRDRAPLTIRGNELQLLRPDPIIAFTLLVKGIPASAQAFVLGASGLAMITLVNRFGVQTTAAFGAALQLWSYAQLPALAVSIGASAMAAQNIGAGRWDRIARIALCSTIYGALGTGVLVLLIQCAGPSASALFLPPDSPARLISARINLIAGPALILISAPMILIGILNATGAVVTPLLILTFALFGVRFSFALLFLDDWQDNAIWWSFPVSAGSATLLTLAYYRYGSWRRARLPVGARSIT